MKILVSPICKRETSSAFLIKSSNQELWQLVPERDI